MSKTLHRQTHQGLITFPEHHHTFRLEYPPNPFWQSTAFLVVIMTIGGLLEFASFEQLFSSFLYDAPLLRDLCIAGMILAFDVAPIPLAFNLCRYSQGYKVSAFAIVVPLAGFLIAVAANLVLRIATASLAFPDLASTGTSIMGGGNVTTSGASSRTVVYAIFFGLLPVISALVSFGIAFSSKNPLKRELKNLDHICLIAAEQKDQIDTILKEYEVDPDFELRLLDQDQNHFSAALSLIHEQRNYFMDYVRERFSEYLADPAATSYLAKYNTRKDEE